MPEASGTLRMGEHSDDPAAYAVLAVSESRFPTTFTALWGNATAEERRDSIVRRWAVLVPIIDPRMGRAADLAVEFDRMRAGYLRPPHLDLLAERIRSENVLTLEVPALVEWGPAGPSVRLRVETDQEDR